MYAKFQENLLCRIGDLNSITRFSNRHTDRKTMKKNHVINIDQQLEYLANQSKNVFHFVIVQCVIWIEEIEITCSVSEV